MSHIVLFDTDDDIAQRSAARNATPSHKTPRRLRGVIKCPDLLLSEEITHALAEQQIDLVTQWDEQCAFALVELTSSATSASNALTPTHSPIIFFGERDHCWQAYDQGGFDFVLHSPQMAEELPWRIRHAVSAFQQFHELDQRARQSQHVAMHALTLNAELGNILHCLEHCFNCADIVALSHECFACLRDMGMSACMTFFLHRQINFYSDDRTLRPIEQQIIMQTRGKQRIVDHGSFSIYHYDHLSVLIRTMPLDNAERYGVLKDHICLLLNGVEARAAGLEAEAISASRAQRCAATAHVIQDIIVDMDAQKRQFTNRSSELLETLLLDLRAEFSQLSLSDVEEGRLNALVENTGQRMAALFRETEAADKTFCEILANLATTLRR